MRAEDFLGIIDRGGTDAPVFRIGTIPASYTAGRPKVQFDGESLPSTRTYPYASSYTPAANDRVLIAMVGHGGVIVAKIV